MKANIIGGGAPQAARVFLIDTITMAEVDAMREELHALRVKVEARDRLIAQQRQDITRLQDV